MDQETSQLLHRLIDLTEENNKILHKMQNKARWAMFFSTMKWILFVGIGIGSYIVIQPYLDQALSLYGQIQTSATQAQGLGSLLSDFESSIKNSFSR